MKSKIIASGRGKLGSGGIEHKGKRIHGHGQQCNNCWGKGCIRGLNGNGKNTINFKLRKIKLNLIFKN